jgi:hypothetical protein
LEPKGFLKTKKKLKFDDDLEFNAMEMYDHQTPILKLKIKKWKDMENTILVIIETFIMYSCNMTHVDKMSKKLCSNIISILYFSFTILALRN